MNSSIKDIWKETKNNDEITQVYINNNQKIKDPKSTIMNSYLSGGET